MQLGELTIEKMKALTGTVFQLKLENGKTTTLKLDEVLGYEVRARRRRMTPKREPFSLFFLGDPETLLPQGMYRLEGEALTLDGIFLVPIGKDESAIEYEAVFT
jgi:hypothetical protein